jgi:uncharacterized membrane protein YphA (DoxX/SURF4 family)
VFDCYATVVRQRKQAGIYVEILIRAPLERVWELTQQPGVHQRWDIRFSSIEYLPKSNDFDLQKFLYETRIGLGLAIRGTGESFATRVAEDGSATSSLKFASDDRLSLIREGAGYWRYIPTAEGLRFLTWYDYRVRFGSVGRLFDRLFRPLIGWATAWSFDRMRLWAEHDIAPEVSLQLAAIHVLSRIAIAAVWFWQGLVPKLLLSDADERVMLAQAGLPENWLPWVGVAEVAMGLLILCTWRRRGMFVLQVLLMIVALVSVARRSPEYLTHAFNPVTLNLLVIAVAIIGWIASANLPTASRCIRVNRQRADVGRESDNL